MVGIDLLGYAASLAVLGTFCMGRMVSLRLLAILSNILFACYGFYGHLHPVLLLHVTLLPINLFRLAQLRKSETVEPLEPFRRS